MKSILEDLNKRKKLNEETKNSIAILMGRKEEILKRLKSEYGVKSTDEAKLKLKEMDEELTILEEQIKSEYEEIKKDYYEGSA